ncbi:helix-turn-helix transcriptional regulator [Lachnospiraceae bacterium OttesenSCG-928-J05]|nr:helix-turn-helix transcriptional regulator [Lachnospiraceae bacterium OttesenSCG-928-J05]
MSSTDPSRLASAMTALGLSAVALAEESGLSNSLISRWQKGARPIPTKGHTLQDLAAALSSLDKEGKLDDLLTAYNDGSSKEQMIERYLLGTDMPGLSLQMAPPTIQRSGEYVAQQRVLLGVEGFRRAALLMLDYLAQLPPGQSLTICAHHNFELWHGNLAFALRFLKRLPKVLQKKAQITLITHNAEGFDGSPYFSVYWLVLQLKGLIRIRYYDGDAPAVDFVASIKGFWSGRLEHDDTAADGLITTLYTDPRNIRPDEAHCADFSERSAAIGQFGFLKDASDKNWLTHPLITEFSVIQRVPSLGLLTAAEGTALLEGIHAKLPAYLFSDPQDYLNGEYTIILCREDVQAGLAKPDRINEPLSALAGQDVPIPRELLASQLERILIAIDQNPSFQVALMPKSAFEKLNLEFICWQPRLALGWLPDLSESLLTDDAATCVGFTNAITHVWGRLHKGWTSKRKVKNTLRKWLSGTGLDEHIPDSATVRNWEVLPKE